MDQPDQERMERWKMRIEFVLIFRGLLLTSISVTVWPSILTAVMAGPSIPSPENGPRTPSGNIKR